MTVGAGLLFASAWLATLGPAPAEVEIPKNDGWVTDLAGLLSAEEEHSLEGLMESYRAGTEHEIALLTLPNLGGEGLERTALEVARAWGIGGKEAHDGALLLVAQAEREIRIEVGRGLEGNLTDSISGRIIRDVIAPSLRQGTYAEGLREGIEAIHAAIGGDYGPIARSRGGREASGGAVGLFAMLIVLFALTMIGIRSRTRRRGRGLTGGSILPWLWMMGMSSGHRGRWGSGGSSGGFGGLGGGGGGGFGGFGGGGGFSGGGASGGW